jgi:hypothetical protein
LHCKGFTGKISNEFFGEGKLSNLLFLRADEFNFEVKRRKIVFEIEEFYGKR